MKTKTCTWTEDDALLWWPACMHDIFLLDGNPHEHHYVFCPYCGKHIISVEYEKDGGSSQFGVGT